MKPEDFFIYLGAIILSLIVFGLIIRWAVRADTIVNNQQAIIAYLNKLCKQQGLPDDNLMD